MKKCFKAYEVDSVSAAVDRMNQGGFAGGRMNGSYWPVGISLQDSEQNIIDVRMWSRESCMTTRPWLLTRNAPF